MDSASKKMKIFVTVTVIVPVEVVLGASHDYGTDFQLRIPSPVIHPSVFSMDERFDEIDDETTCGIKDQAILTALSAAQEEVQKHIKREHKMHVTAGEFTAKGRMIQ